MTNEQINEAIAKACEWRKEDGVYVWHGNGIDRTCWELWDYCTDLNAMHEAEKTLNSWDNYVQYQAWLGYCGGNAIVQLHECITATARQRAEAFLRTLGKWEEAE